MQHTEIKFIDKSGQFPDYGILLISRLVTDLGQFELMSKRNDQRKWIRQNGDVIEQTDTGVRLDLAAAHETQHFIERMQKEAIGYTSEPITVKQVACDE